MEDSSLDLVVAGRRDGVLMVESEARELSEQTMLDSIMQGHESMQEAIAAIEHLGKEAGRKPWDWQPPTLPEETIAALRAAAETDIAAAYDIVEKSARAARLSEVRSAAAEKALGDSPSPLEKNLIGSQLKKIEAAVVRERILSGEPRIDGRGTRKVRPIAIRLGVLAADSRFGAFHPRRNAGAGGDHNGLGSRRAKD